MGASRPRSPVRGAWLVAALVMTAGMFALVFGASRPPRVVPADAPARAFSAERAMSILSRLLGTGVALPHPVGSAANVDVRGRVAAEFEALGLETTLQERFVCNDEGACAEVVNVLARIPGRTGPDAGDGILLVAHYDSVPAGPGAGDDLSGVACLVEIARALRAEPEPLDRPVLFLVTDGEELGLLGAHAFARHHPWVESVGAVLNLEARGSSGPSILFETGADNAGLVELYARTATRPSATSYSVEVYRRMPNDTDFSPFRERGLAGLNFAFIEDVHNYHTRNDTLERLDPSSLQHHGDNVLPLVRALGQADPDARSIAGDMVYCDLFGRVVLRWRASWNVPILLVEAALLLVGLARVCRGAGIVPGRVWLAALATLGVGAAAALTGAGVALLLGLRPGAIGALQPLPIWIAYLCSTILVWMLAAGRGRSSLELFCGVGLAWLGGATLTTLAAPGASHLFTLPLAVLVVGLFIPGVSRGLEHRPGMLVALAVSALTTLLWSPFVYNLGVAFGPGQGAAIAGAIAFAAPWIAAIARAAGPVARRSVSIAAALGLLAALLVGLFQERVSEGVPGHLTFRHLVDLTEGTALIAAESGTGALPAVVRKGFTGDPGGIWPGVPGTHAAPAAVLDDAGPELEVVATGDAEEGRRVHVILRSPGGADRTWLQFEPGALVTASVVTSQGERVAVTPVGGRFVIARVPASGLELELTLRSSSPVSATVADESFRASEEIRALRAACGPGQVGRRSGDTILLRTRFSL